METVWHVFQCPSPGSAAQMALLVEDRIKVLTDAGVRVNGPSLLEPVAPAAARRGSVCWVPVWFDHSCRFWKEVMLECGHTRLDYDRRDPLGAILGVLPVGLERLLRWGRNDAGTGWEARSLGAQSDLMNRLRLTLIRGAFRVYRERCRRMDAWWRLPAQGPARARLAACSVERARARARNRDRREREACIRRQALKRARRVRGLGQGARAPMGAVGPETGGLVLTLDLEPGGREVGGNVRFCLSVTSTSSVRALGVAVAAPLPSGYDFVVADDPDFDGGSGWWTVGVLGEGEVRCVRITALPLAVGDHLLFAQVVRRSGRRRVPIDYHADLVYSRRRPLGGAGAGLLLGTSHAPTSLSTGVSTAP